MNAKEPSPLCDSRPQASEARFSPEVERIIQTDRIESHYPDPPPVGLSLGEKAKAEKWRQIVGKWHDPKIVEWVSERIEIEEELERCWDEFRGDRITYDEMIERFNPLKRRQHGMIGTLLDEAIKSKDSELFRAVADILDFIRENGIPKVWDWKTNPGEEGEFLRSWEFLMESCPLEDGEVRSVFVGDDRIELRHRFPSLGEIWLVGCHHFGWCSSKWKLAAESEKAKDRLRQFLNRKKLPHCKTPR